MDSAIRIMKNISSTCIDMVEKIRTYEVQNHPQQSTAAITWTGSHATSFLLTPQRRVHPTDSHSNREREQQQNVRKMTVDNVSLQEFEKQITALRKRHPSNTAMMQSASVCVTDSLYMKQVVVQDIQPCLLMNQGQAYSLGKQSGWIGVMLHAKSMIGTGIHCKLGNTTH